jgi:uncharacterized membrane protein
MHRIVIYQPGSPSEDPELVAAIASLAGLERGAVTALLASSVPARLENLDEAGAADLLELLAARGIDADLEPMRPPAGVLEWLRGEAPKWVKRGLVHPASLPRIFANYGLEPPAAPGPPAAAAPRKKEVGTGTLLRAVLTLGAVLVGLGLILFVAANWQRIPAAAKIVGSLVLTLAALHAGSRLAAATRPRLAAALLLIALFGIGAVLVLIAQAYHVLSDSYLLPLVWGALCLPVALLQRFRPALYVASGLWLVSYWLHLGELGRLPWIYPILLVGFLLPYGVIAGDRRFHVAHLGVLMVALTTTLVTGDVWHGSVFVAALALLRLRYREPVYDWLLMAGFFIWQFVFQIRFDDLPNVFYALPLAYFFYRAHTARSSALMIATVVNTQIWLGILLFQTGERLVLGAVEGAEVLLWLLAAGLLWFGIGKRLEPSPEWRPLSIFLRFGGAALAGLMVYVLGFNFYEHEESFYGSPLFLGTTLVSGAMGLTLAAAPVLRRTGVENRRWGTPLLLALTATSLVLSFLAPPSLLIHPLFFNLTLFAGALGMMLRGHRAQSLAWFNAGIALFVALITSRYLDTFVEYLPRSVFFVMGGLFLIGWAVLVDRQRKRSAAQPAGGDDA